MNLIPPLTGFSTNHHEWFVEDISLTDIAKEFNTPTYVYSLEALTTAFMAYDKACFRKDGSRRANIHFAMKSNSNLAILDIFNRLGAGFDLVSAGELARVMQIGVNPKKCVFSGVGKSKSEIEYALTLGLKCFNVESIPELYRINQIAGQLGLTANISLRVNPDIDAKTHPYISTGLNDNKFGIAYEDVIPTYMIAQQMPHCKIKGIDCHIGSQITDTQPYIDALNRILGLITELQDLGITFEHLDIGGGLGIVYADESPPHITEFANTLLDHIEAKGFGHLEVIFEPGRSLVGNAGILLTEIEYLKPGETKNFCIVNAAMNDLMRPSMYEAYHAIVAVKSKENLPVRNYDVVGPVCESGDWLGRDRDLAVEPGDLLAILSAGAYGASMSSNYNSRGRAAEVIVNKAQAHLVRERESIADLFSKEHIIKPASNP